MLIISPAASSLRAAPLHLLVSLTTWSLHPPRQFLRWAEDRGVAAAGCWSGHWSGGGSLLQPARARTAEPGATQATEYLSQLVKTTAVLSQPSKFCKGQITDLYDIVVRSGLEAWRGTCAASAMVSRSQVRGCSAAWLVRVCCDRELGAGSTGSSRAERTE